MIPELDAIKRLLLNEWDPIGVAGISEAVDEYDSYAMRVFTMLASGATAETIAEYLGWVVTERMELRGNAPHDRQAADKAVAIHLGHARI